MELRGIYWLLYQSGRKQMAHSNGVICRVFFKEMIYKLWTWFRKATRNSAVLRLEREEEGRSLDQNES